MYFSGFKYDVDHWKVNRDFFRFGPCLGIIVRDTKSGRNTLKWLNEHKGHALPVLRAQNSLRYRHSESRLFNIVHVPDMHNEMISELLGWFRFTEITLLENRKCISGSQIIQEMRSHNYFEENHLRPFKVIQSLQTRVIHSITATVGQDISDWWFDGSKKAGCCARVSIFTKEISRSRLIFDDVLLGNSFSNSACYFFAALNYWKVFVSDLERFLVESGFTYGKNK